MNKSYGMGKMITRVIFIIVAILLVIAFSRKIFSGSDLSFSAFWNWLGGVKTFGPTKVVSVWTIGGDWGLVDGLRRFFNAFGNLFGVVFFLFANLISLLMFLLQFLSFIFI